MVVNTFIVSADICKIELQTLHYVIFLISNLLYISFFCHISVSLAMYATLTYATLIQPNMRNNSVKT